MNYVLSVGPTYRKTVTTSPNWTLVYDYHPVGTEVHVDGWEYIDGVCCEVFRHPNGGVIAQPTKVCEAAAVVNSFELPLAA
jgi:hypothetical protein